MVELESGVGRVRNESNRLAIVMPSFGARPWLEGCARTFACYARAVGATLHVERELPSPREFPLPKLADRPGRKNKLAYACKAFLAWKYLAVQGYDRVAVVDDSCCVRRGSPSLFDAVPFGRCGYTRTSPTHAQDSFDFIADFVKKAGLPDIAFEKGRYMNSGVMVYDRTMIEALSPAKICAGAPLLFAPTPNQTLTYYLLVSGGIPQHEISKAFNTMPGQGLPPEGRRDLVDIRPHVQPDVFIYHLSAWYRRREQLLEQLSTLFLAEWEAEGTLNA